jgi:hypothetical protein
MRDVLAAVMRESVATKTFAHSLAIVKRVAVVTAAGGLLAAVLPVLQSSTALAGTYETPQAYETPCAITCFLINEAGLGIVGSGHGTELKGSETGTAGSYTWVDEDEEIWGIMKAGNYCWDENSGHVYIETCLDGNHNEWFAFETCPNSGGPYCIQNYVLGTGKNLAVAIDGNPLTFSDLKNSASEWGAYYDPAARAGISRAIDRLVSPG